MKTGKWFSILVFMLLTGGLFACPDCREHNNAADRGEPSLSAPITPFRLSGSKRYAVIINGDTSALHRANVKLFHDTLIKQGYASRDILILNTERTDRSGAVGGYEDRGSLDGVRKLFGLLASNLTDRDTLTVYVTGHGTRLRSRAESAIVLAGHSYLAASDLRALVDRLRFRQMVFVTEICYSGGLVEALVRNNTRNVIAISPTDSRHTTYCRYFIRAFCDAFEKTDTDLNRDGSISVFEAYTYAIGVHKSRLRGREKETNGQYKSCGERRDVVIGKKPDVNTPGDNGAGDKGPNDNGSGDSGSAGNTPGDDGSNNGDRRNDDSDGGEGEEYE